MIIETAMVLALAQVCEPPAKPVRVLGTVRCYTFRKFRRGQSAALYHKRLQKKWNPITPRRKYKLGVERYDKRTRRQRRAMVTYITRDQEKKALLNRIKERQREYHCRRKPRSCQ
tara:strand:- start:760 stop:1104 length:345 start_codon:yes stop_codon:yes gene_type:complete